MSSYRKYPADPPRWTAPVKLIAVVLGVFVADRALHWALQILGH